MVGRGRIGAWARGEMKYRKTCVFQLSGGILFWQSRASNSLVSFLFYKFKLPGVFSVKSASQDSLEASLPGCSQELELVDVTQQSPGSLQQ